MSRSKKASEIKYVAYKYADDTNVGGPFNPEDSKKSVSAKKYQDEDGLIKGMTKEIIMCDYNKIDYHLPDPKRPDFLNLGLH